jgi:hypothetical protein
MRSLPLSLILLVCASPAAAADRNLVTMWMVGESLVSAETRLVKRGDFILQHRLLPMGLVELTSAGAEDLLPGKQLVEIRAGDAAVFCDPAIKGQKLIGHAQPCLVDADRDGTFEGMFLTTSVTKGMLTIQGKRPKDPRPIAPIAYRRVDPTAFKEALFVGLQYRGNANPVGNHVFEVNYGTAEKMGSLSSRITRKGDPLPAPVQFMGAQFTILSGAAEGIRVQIDRPLPSQPFGVLQTTTYRFY